MTSITATCKDITTDRIDIPGVAPTGLTVGKEYIVHLYTRNTDNNKKTEQIRITNDKGHRASYVASRFDLALQPSNDIT